MCGELKVALRNGPRPMFLDIFVYLAGWDGLGHRLPESGALLAVRGDPRRDDGLKLAVVLSAKPRCCFFRLRRTLFLIWPAALLSPDPRGRDFLERGSHVMLHMIASTSRVGVDRAPTGNLPKHSTGLGSRR